MTTRDTTHVFAWFVKRGIANLQKPCDNGIGAQCAGPLTGARTTIMNPTTNTDETAAWESGKHLAQRQRCSPAVSPGRPLVHACGGYREPLAKEMVSA